jgi:hypothetical protein
VKTKNPLTLWIQQFQRHQPRSTVGQAWDHLLTVAPAFGQLPWVSTIDTNGQAIAYRRRPGDPETVVNRASFARQFQRCKKRQTA